MIVSAWNRALHEPMFHDSMPTFCSLSASMSPLAIMRLLKQRDHYTSKLQILFRCLHLHSYKAGSTVRWHLPRETSQDRKNCEHRHFLLGQTCANFSESVYQTICRSRTTGPISHTVIHAARKGGTLQRTGKSALNLDRTF